MNPLGINLSFAVKRWPEPEAWASFVREELDLSLVQFSFDLLDPWWPEELTRPLASRIRKAVEANDLTVHSAFVGLAAYTYNGLLHPEEEGRKAAVLWYRRAIDIAAEIGAHAIGGPVGGISVPASMRSDEGDRQARYQELLETLTGLSAYAKSQGIKELLIEPTPLPREIPTTPTEAKQLAVDLEDHASVPIRYCLDVGHALYEPLYGPEANVESWLTELGDRIGLVHLQQTDGQSDSHWCFTRQGVVTPDSIAYTLQAAGLKDTPLLLEVFYPFELDDQHVTTDIKEGVRISKQALTHVSHS